MHSAPVFALKVQGPPDGESPVAALLKLTPRLHQAAVEAARTLGEQASASIPVEDAEVRWLKTVAVRSDGSLGGVRGFVCTDQYAETAGYQAVADIEDDSMDFMAEHACLDQPLPTELRIGKDARGWLEYALVATTAEGACSTQAYPTTDFGAYQEALQRLDRPPTMEDLALALRAIVEDADDTGCEGVHTVDSALIERAEALLERQRQAREAGTLPQPAQDGSTGQAAEQAHAGLSATANALVEALSKRYPSLALADVIAEAVSEDEKPENGGCDISAGLFGPHFSAVVRGLAAMVDEATQPRERVRERA